MQHTEYTIGIDIGGTNTTWGIVNRKGTIFETGGIKTRDYPSTDLFFDDLRKQILPVIHQYETGKINGIGIGAPQANFYTGEIIDAANLPWKGVLKIKEIAEKYLGLHTTITNDANATAIGEMTYGAAKGMGNFIVVTLGTGVGSGIVANGKLIYGHTGMAGELGHTIVVRNGRQCGCGRKGCLETYTSATGIVTTAMEFLRENNNKRSSDNPKWLCNIYQATGRVKAHEIYEAAVAGDDTAIAIFNYTGEILGQSFANVAAITEPQAIILFGGLAQAGEYILGPARRAMESNLLFCYKGNIALIQSALEERNASILGAAAMGWL